jgi:hypothetical protein
MSIIGNLALAPPPEPPVGPAPVAQVERAARAPIGWMRAEDAHRVLMGSRGDLAPDVTLIELAQRARAAVAARPEGVNQDQIITDCPAELAAHVGALRRNQAGAQMFAEGWDVATVDLTRVCGFQPLVFSDKAVERVGVVDVADVASVGAVTLPLGEGVQIPLQYDQIQKAWVASSANPNLGVIAAAGPIPTAPGGPLAFGFVLAVRQSFLQVARYNGRYFLRDGYHRAFGLLSLGITKVPAFVRELTAFEELMADPRVMLPQDAYRGPRPPVLPDYLDDTVSTTVRQPAIHRMVVIQALELTPFG